MVLARVCDNLVLSNTFGFIYFFVSRQTVFSFNINVQGIVWRDRHP
jgi:hypothetical protein